jgi:hypothetical protein
MKRWEEARDKRTRIKDRLLVVLGSQVPGKLIKLIATYTRSSTLPRTIDAFPGMRVLRSIESHTIPNKNRSSSNPNLQVKESFFSELVLRPPESSKDPLGFCTQLLFRRNDAEEHPLLRNQCYRYEGYWFVDTDDHQTNSQPLVIVNWFAVADGTPSWLPLKYEHCDLIVRLTLTTIKPRRTQKHGLNLDKHRSVTGLAAHWVAPSLVTTNNKGRNLELFARMGAWGDSEEPHDDDDEDVVQCPNCGACLERRVSPSSHFSTPIMSSADSVVWPLSSSLSSSATANDNKEEEEKKKEAEGGVKTQRCDVWGCYQELTSEWSTQPRYRLVGTQVTKLTSCHKKVRV